MTTFLSGALAMGDPFLQFAEEHGKNYSTRAELDHRRAIFEKNYMDMVEHNAKFEIGEVSWHRKVTPYYDLTTEEFASLRLRKPNPTPSKTPENRVPQAHLDKLSKVKSPPNSWNWVDQGGITSVKDQGHCGSCSAFAATACVETCFWQATGNLYDDLSEQFILDCGYGHEYHDSSEGWFGAYGCDGAWTFVYFDYLINHHGGRHYREDHYQYEAEEGSCRSHNNGYYNNAKVSDMAIHYYPSEELMKKWIYISPIGTSLDANYLGDYDYGVYDDHRCCESAHDSTCSDQNNHDITIVGYGTEHGKDYWLIKNSWGKGFGEDGYFKIARGTGLCGMGGYEIEAAICDSS